jgi:hypothetical protein
MSQRERIAGDCRDPGVGTEQLRRRMRSQMSDRPVSLQLAETILDVFRNSGATQLEQCAALDVARALVPYVARPLSILPTLNLRRHLPNSRD